MRTLLLGSILLSLSSGVFAQDSTSTRLGLGYGIGSSAGVDLSWNCPHHQIDLLFNASYDKQNLPEGDPNGGYYIYETTNEYASIGLDYFWLCTIDKNFYFAYGPIVTLEGVEGKTDVSEPAVQSSSTNSYFITHIALGAGPEYWFNSHFVVQGMTNIGANITGQSTVSSSSGYPASYGTSLFLGGTVDVRYIF